MSNKTKSIYFVQIICNSD